jgi:endonuclease/exonuclease/phosphatase family metal-dependent hydrolase
MCEATPTFNRDVQDPEKVNEFAIDTPGRIKHIMRIVEVRMARGEIICLQEASETFMENPALKSVCDAHHYSYIHDTADRRPIRGMRGPTGKPVLRTYLGLVILFPRRRFSPVATSNLTPFGGPPTVDDMVRLGEIEQEIQECMAKLSDKTLPGGERGALSAKIKKLRQMKDELPSTPDVTENRKDRGILLAVLQDRAAPEVIFGVATTHVPCNFKDHVLMREYAVRIKRELSRWMQEKINQHLPHKVPTLICGDMNSEKDSPFYNEILRDGEYEDPFNDIRDKRSSTVYSYTDNSVKENLKAPRSLDLDHVFTPIVGLDVVRARHPFVPDDKRSTALPSADWPSDHMPVEITVRVQQEYLYSGVEPGLVLYTVPPPVKLKK